MKKIIDILQIKKIKQKDIKSNIRVEHQARAFAMAEKLGIILSGKDTGRFIKIFKDEATGARKYKATTDQAYSFLKDYTIRPLNNAEKINYFFWIINNGIKTFGKEEQQ